MWQKLFQIFGSVLLFAGTAFLVWAFFYETYAARGFSELSRAGLYAVLGGTVFHFFGAAWKNGE